MAERIFKGAEPGKLPVEFQKELELHLNLTSAKQMGVTIPPALLESADKTYE
jgi:putative ABC transport system substrate-binding protein